jgi:hypothetical protein
MQICVKDDCGKATQHLTHNPPDLLLMAVGLAGRDHCVIETAPRPLKLFDKQLIESKHMYT